MESIDFDTAYELLMGGEELGGLPQAPLASLVPSAPTTPQNTHAQLASLSAAITPQRTFNEGIRMSPLGESPHHGTHVLTSVPSLPGITGLPGTPTLGHHTLSPNLGLTPTFMSPTYDLLRQGHFLPSMDLLSNTETVAIESFLDSMVKPGEVSPPRALGTEVGITHANVSLDHGSPNHDHTDHVGAHFGANETTTEIMSQPSIGLGVSADVVPKAKTKTKAVKTAAVSKRRTFDREERKRNHIESEQRRRNLIREAFDNLQQVLDASSLDFSAMSGSEEPAPKRKRARKTPTKLSKSAVLARAIWEIRQLEGKLAEKATKA